MKVTTNSPLEAHATEVVCVHRHTAFLMAYMYFLQSFLRVANSLMRQTAISLGVKLPKYGRLNGLK